MLIVSKITVLDEDKELWETHIGNSEMELLFSVWGKTEDESRRKAEEISEKLTLLQIVS
jgi:VIT1/CCC1 family predicted Fe2+/Mn2+ transporter